MWIGRLDNPSIWGFERSGHRIELEDIEDLLKYLGYEVEYKEISDEEMEELN